MSNPAAINSPFTAERSNYEAIGDITFVQYKRPVPIRTPVAGPRAKVRPLAQTNKRLARNRAKYLKVAEQNCIELTGKPRF